MNDAERTLTRMLAAEARGELSEAEGRELQAMLEARMRELDPQPRPPWDHAWRHLQRRIRGQLRVTMLASTAVAVAVAALVTFGVHGSPHPWVVLGGLTFATLSLIYAGLVAWRRATAIARIAPDDSTALFVAMRDDLDREITLLRGGGIALTVVLTLAFGGLVATVGLSRPSAIAVSVVCLVVLALVVRELLVTLPRLVEQRRGLE